MTGSIENYPGRYTVPSRSDPHGAYLPRGPPLPNPDDPNVLRFTSTHQNVGSSQVVDHTNTQLYHFQSIGKGHLEMYDTANNLIARYVDGKVVYRESGPIKGKKFVQHSAAGKTGTVFIYEGNEYEIVQELFYAIVRTVHTCERVAIIYNYTGKLAVEMTETGIGDAGLQLHLVFVTALMESEVMKHGPSRLGKASSGLGKAIRNMVPKKST